MKRLLYTCILLLFVLSPVSAKKSQKENKTFRFGFSGGATSAMYTVDKLMINNSQISHPQNQYQLGFKLSGISRIQIADKHFIQTELSYQHGRCEIQFEGSAEEQYVYINNRIKTLEIPVMYGISFINEKPYSASLMLGGQIKYTINQKSQLRFTNMDVSGKVTEKLYPLNYSIVAGLNIMISKLFFDFRVEKGLANLSRHINIPTPDNESTKQLYSMEFKRTCESVSFTIGYMF